MIWTVSVDYHEAVGKKIEKNEPVVKKICLFMVF